MTAISSSEHAEWLAGLIRILFRARDAHDAKAIEVAFRYFEDYLSKVLHRHLSLHDPEWDNAPRLFDYDPYRWFDGLGGELEYPAPGRLRLRGEAYWLIGQGQGHYDPYCFEMELCPKTGAFLRYLLRFGDSRPVAETVRKSPSPGVPRGAWSYEFEKRRFDNGVRSG